MESLIIDSDYVILREEKQNTYYKILEFHTVKIFDRVLLTLTKGNKLIYKFCTPKGFEKWEDDGRYNVDIKFLKEINYETYKKETKN